MGTNHVELSTAGDPFEKDLRARAALRVQQGDVEQLAATLAALPSAASGESAWPGPPEAAATGLRDAVSEGEGGVAELARLDSRIAATEAEISALEAQRRKQIVLLIVVAIVVIVVLGKFLRALLQQLYEVMFSRLSASGAGDGPALVRLRAALFSLAGFLREHRAAVARLLLDAGQGEVVVQDFLRANAPRHLALLMQLLSEAAAEGDLNEAPPLQRFVFVMSSVAAPLLIAQGVARLNVAPELVTAHLDEQVLSDAAIRQRIDWALAALGARGAGPGTPIGPRPAAPAELPAAAPSVPTPSSPSVTLAPSSRRSR